MKPYVSARLTSTAFILMLLAVTAIAAGVPQKAMAQPIPVAVVKCASCESPDAMMQAAGNYFSQWDGKTPPGYVGTVQDLGPCADLPSSVTTAPTVVIVVSTAIAISDSYYACWIYPHGTSVLRAYSFTGGTFSSAIAEDNQLFSRALINSGRVTLPSNYAFNGEGGSSPNFLIGAWLSGDASAGNGNPFQLLGSGVDPWHGLGDTGVPDVMYEKFLNTQNGQTFTAWNGDTIKVYDKNGWSATFQFVPSGDPKWQIVSNSIRDAQGKPVDTTSSVVPVPGGTSQSIGPIDVSLPGDPGFYITPWYDNPTPDGTITVGPIQVPNGGGGNLWECTVNPSYTRCQ